MTTPAFPVVIQAILEDHEIRPCIVQLAHGPIEGYEWRCMVTYPKTATAESHRAWTPWIFGMPHQVDAFLADWAEILSTQGHHAKHAPPGETSH